MVKNASKFMFRMEYEKVLKFGLIYFLREQNDMEQAEDFPKRVKNITKAIVRDRYLKKGFANRDEMYLFAIGILKSFYDNPYRFIIQFLG